MLTAGLCSTDMMASIAADAESSYVLLQLDSRVTADITLSDFDRLARVADDTDAVMVYSDYFMDDSGIYSEQRLTDYLEGSVRDDFNFGALVLIKSQALREAVASLPPLSHAAWYATRLALSLSGKIVHIPEPLYTASKPVVVSQFDYVDPRNREVQIEMEKAFTHHLSAVGALLTPPFETFEPQGDFPVEASVIIPVRNRIRTVGDAVESALAQQADFDFNVIVIDNHSSDGTTELLASLAKHNPRLIHVIPTSHTLGIGGCWNEGVNHPACGRYAVQLDSDDLYSSPSTLSKIIELFHKEKPAMVIGSYKLTDFNLNPIPPGVIDHKEWTNDNGANNALRINGLGAPRAFCTELLRRFPFPNVSYGEDYATVLRLTRNYRLSRIYDVLYLCRRWEGNSDSALPADTANRYNHYKDSLRTWEINARKK